MKVVKIFLSILSVVIISGCHSKDSYVEIESANKELSKSDVLSGNFETLSGTWYSEVGKNENQMILTIDKEGNVKVFNDNKEIKNKGSLVVANDNTFDKGYLVMNVKGIKEGKERNIYAGGQMGQEQTYSKFDRNLYFFQGKSEFNRDEVGFDFSRESEDVIKYDIPKKITKDTLIFQENEKPKEKGYGRPNPIHYTVFHRKNEMNEQPTPIKSNLNIDEIKNRNLSSIAGNWRNPDGHSFKVYSDGRGESFFHGSTRRGVIEFSTVRDDIILGDFGKKTEQWVIPIYANGDIGREVDGVDGDNIQIIKSGETVGATKNTFLYDIFELPDGVPRLSVIDRDVLTLTDHFDEYFESPSKVFFREKEMKQFADVKNENIMNIDGLVKGDFSTVVGTWGVPEDQGIGNRIRIDEKGVLTWIGSRSAERIIHDVKHNGDNSGIGIFGKEFNWETVTPSNYINFIPAGVAIKGEENSDSSKDRIIFGSIEKQSDRKIFYRLDE
jgi:lipoprotein